MWSLGFSLTSLSSTFIYLLKVLLVSSQTFSSLDSSFPYPNSSLMLNPSGSYTTCEKSISFSPIDIWLLRTKLVLNSSLKQVYITCGLTSCFITSITSSSKGYSRESYCRLLNELYYFEESLLCLVFWKMKRWGRNLGSRLSTFVWPPIHSLFSGGECGTVQLWSGPTNGCWLGFLRWGSYSF